VKPRKVPKLGPDATLADAVRRIATVRAREVESFVPQALDPAEAKAQHDMRIAAKRLRYLLELVAPALGEPAADGAKAAKRLQTVLGEIHDCDEMLDRTQRHVERLRGEDAEALRHAAGGARDLDPAVARAAPNRARYRGLESLAAYLTARRSVLFERFVRDWESFDREGFATQLIEALSRRDLGSAGRAPAAPADGAGA
jgi:hypothetical protein